MITIVSIPDAVVSLYKFGGVVGCIYAGEVAGRKTHAESLMIIAGHEVTLFWDELPSPSDVSKLMWRLA